MSFLLFIAVFTYQGVRLDVTREFVCAHGSFYAGTCESSGDIVVTAIKGFSVRMYTQVVGA